MKKTFIINITLLYLSSFILVYFASTIITKWVSSWIFSIPTDFHRWGLIFTIPDSSPLWNHGSVIGIYVAGLITAVFIAIFSIKYFYSNIYQYRSIFNLFIIFLYSHSINLIFGGLAIGIFLKTGFGYVPRWIGFDNVILYIIAGLSLFILFRNGFFLNPYITAYGYIESHYNNSNDQSKFKLHHFILPLIIIHSLLFILGFPDNTWYLKLLNLSMLLQLPGLLIFIYIPNEMKGNFALTKKISKTIIYSFIFLIALMIIISL